MSNFVVFYDDGSQIVGNAESLESVKSFGVIGIVQERADGRNHILSQKDYYVFVGNHWICLDTIGLVDYNVHKLSAIKKVIVGRTIDNQSFYDIMERAKTYV